MLYNKLNTASFIVQSSGDGGDDMELVGEFEWGHFQEVVRCMRFTR